MPNGTSLANPEDGCEPGTGNAAKTFVNRGLLRWEAERKAWLAGGSGGPVSRRRARARTMDVGEVIDDLFSGRGGNGTLPQSVPLPQMIDLLVDLWEAEGLFD